MLNTRGVLIVGGGWGLFQKLINGGLINRVGIFQIGSLSHCKQQNNMFYGQITLPITNKSIENMNAMV